jgi:pimeloyl-ACP methyl ester carboxylesterase
MDAPLPISKDQFDIWVKAYLESDPTSRQRTPRSARAPAGPELDFRDAWSGQFPYDPAIITRPTAIVRGEWDAVTQDDDAAWLTNAMRNVPDRARDLKLPGGAHRMHLEGNRQALFEAVGAYLSEEPR